MAVKMKHRSYPLKFMFARKKFEAVVDVIQVKGHHNYPMYRVAIPREKGPSDIYIWYETNWGDERFFSYSGRDEEMKKAIVKALEREG
ncbi:MAG: hypothetical protein J7497_12480 [Chitinophagaceae bacterium]|nr:hypothetical protein [Chitinophagaceae bacterium]